MGYQKEGILNSGIFIKELYELPLGEEKNMKTRLEKNEIAPLQKCINFIYDKAGEIYELPNYCINGVRKGNKQIKIKSPNIALVDKIKRNISNKMET